MLLITGDRLMLWPKLIVNLTIPVSGGHHIPTDCLSDHRETVLIGPSLQSAIDSMHLDWVEAFEFGYIGFLANLSTMYVWLLSIDAKKRRNLFNGQRGCVNI